MREVTAGCWWSIASNEMDRMILETSKETMGYPLMTQLTKLIDCVNDATILLQPFERVCEWKKTLFLTKERNCATDIEETTADDMLWG